MTQPSALQIGTRYLYVGGAYTVKASKALWAYSEPYLNIACKKAVECFFRVRPFLETSAKNISSLIAFISIPVSILAVVELYRKVQHQEGIAKVLLAAYQIVVIACVVLNIIVLTTAPEAQTLTYPLLTATMAISFGLGVMTREEPGLAADIRAIL